MKIPTEKVGFRILSYTKGTLTRIAEEKGISVTALINRILIDNLEKYTVLTPEEKKTKNLYKKDIDSKILEYARIVNVKKIYFKNNIHKFLQKLSFDGVVDTKLIIENLEISRSIARVYELETEEKQITEYIERLKHGKTHQIYGNETNQINTDARRLNKKVVPNKVSIQK